MRDKRCRLAIQSDGNGGRREGLLNRVDDGLTDKVGHWAEIDQYNYLSTL
jgi:hypothetical protein